MLIDLYSVVPSPYQRDLFAALHARGDVTLRVFYLEHAAPDSPWGRKELRSWESVLPGSSFGKGRVRCHFNRLPDLPEPADITIINTPTTALTTQRLFRKNLPGRRFFWGEELLPPGLGIKGRLNRFLRAPIGRCDGILAIGRRAVRRYQHDFPHTPVENVPYFTDLKKFHLPAEPENPSPSTPLTFLFCGQMIRRKGLDILLQAFDGLISKHNLDTRLLVAGRPSEEKPWLAAMSEHARAKVEVIGFVAPAELPALFKRADVFVLPSMHDGWGVVVNQAIGAGIGIIASDGVGAAVELVDNGKNGRIVPAGDPDQLVEAMAEVVRDPTIASQWSRCSRSKAAEIGPEEGARRIVQILCRHLTQ